MKFVLKLAVVASGCAAALGLLSSLALPDVRAATGSGGVMRLTGTGLQIYACSRAGDRFAWRFERPDATLTDAGGHIKGHHGAGPNWTAGDGSAVYGTTMTTLPAPAAAGVPWLVLRATRHDGAGVMSDVGYILRTDTQGGTAPATGCDAAHDAAEARVPYHATYAFLNETVEVSR